MEPVKGFVKAISVTREIKRESNRGPRLKGRRDKRQISANRVIVRDGNCLRDQAGLAELADRIANAMRQCRDSQLGKLPGNRQRHADGYFTEAVFACLNRDGELAGLCLFLCLSEERNRENRQTPG